MNDATEWLFGLQRFGMEPGLERIRRLLDDLGSPDARFESVLVGGTNGKGATAGALAAMSSADGVRTGLFTSPHLTHPGERIVVDGGTASQEAFEDVAAAVRPSAEALGATFFEVVTAMACLAFAEAGCRRAVFEVGLGGRLDATNALDPAASVVTNVAIDHVEVLGGSLRSIAREKAGILRSGRVAWTAASGDGLAVLDEEARRLGARLSHLGGEARATVRSRGWDGIEVTVETAAGRTTLNSPLLGRHQGPNLALAALAGRSLGLTEAGIVRGARSFAWPGRLERIDARAAGLRVPVLLDGAHNPAAARALARSLRELGVRPHLVLGLSADKDAAGVLAALAPAVASLRLTRARTSPRAAAPARLREVAAEAGVAVAGEDDDPMQAVRAAADAAIPDDEDPCVLVAGSLYLVGEVRPQLLGGRAEGRPRLQ